MGIPAKKKLKSILGQVAGATGLYARGFRSKMVIVAFHRVSRATDDDPLTCTSERFVQFCTFFRRHFDVVPLAEQISGCSVGKDLGGTLSITFDDGYRDNYEVAAPVLRDVGLPATFLVTTGFIGTQIVAPWDQDLPQQPGWMRWDQVRELVAQGFEIGCHTDSHLDLGTVDLQRLRVDLETAKRKISSELGRSASLFAYPFGGPGNITARSREAVREAGFTCCMSCYGGVNTSTADPYRLMRIPIAEWFATPNQFGFELLLGRYPRDDAHTGRQPDAA